MGQSYTFPVIKWVSNGDVIDSMVTAVNNTVSHIWKQLGEWIMKVLTVIKEIGSNMYADVC